MTLALHKSEGENEALHSSLQQSEKTVEMINISLHNVEKSKLLLGI
jgi:hypothetical protein